MAAVPSDFLSSTFADPEDMTSAKIFARILAVINSLFAWARTVKIPAYGTQTGTTSAGGFATITHGLGAVPSQLTVTGRTGHVYTINNAFSPTSTQFQIFVQVPNTGVGLNAGTYNCDFVAWP